MTMSTPATNVNRVGNLHQFLTMAYHNHRTASPVHICAQMAVQPSSSEEIHNFNMGVIWRIDS